MANRAAYWAKTLTAIPSVTGTAEEAAFAGRLVALLRAQPVFGGGAASLETLPIPGGLYPRRAVLVLLRGKGRRTLVLTGHFDVVEIDCYGALKPLAYDPDRLLPALIEALASEPPSVANERALGDFRSGRFLPGRGLLDMKAGLAAALAAMEAFAGDPDRRGNLLFVAVPDEEANSAGARAAAPALADFAARHGLDLLAAINMDAIADEGDGSAGRAVALGTVGKLLPTALVVGKPAHASYAFRGLGAAALAGALAAEMEWLPELTERYGDEVLAGPTLLGMKDTRQGYDVTMPGRVWMYWNVALLTRGPGEVLAAVGDAAHRAADALLDRLEARRAAAGAEGAREQVRILTYAELFREVAARRGNIADTLAGMAGELAATGATLPETARALTEALWEMSGLNGPAIVLGFGSTPYVPVLLGDDPAARRLRHAIKGAMQHLNGEGARIGIRPFFPAISDVSFFGEAVPAGLATIADNTPMWRPVLQSATDRTTAGLPAVNIGPWGRDYHGRLERLETDYAFSVLPRLLLEIAVQLLAEGD